jgi:hypothetical protein
MLGHLQDPRHPTLEGVLVNEIHITITVSQSEPNRDRLAIADRYLECANQAVDVHQRRALTDEAERIYREERA